MNSSKGSASTSDHINFKLQKTISNLISNVISSLCQQFIRYEHSVDIFGLLSINIDEDVEISVKLNEKFIKKDMINTPTSFDCAKLIETIKKGSDQQKQNLSDESPSSKMDTEDTAKDGKLLTDDNEKDYLAQKRRPRKPQQTFRYVIPEDVQSSKEARKDQSPLSEADLQELKIDTQFVCEPNLEKLTLNNTGINDEIEEKKSNDTEECEERHPRPQDSSPKRDSDQKALNPCKSNNLFKCTVCDRQFKRKFCLTRHKRVHQNLKTYNCNLCGLGFDLVNQLKRHMRNIHLYNRDSLRRSARTNHSSDSHPKDGHEPNGSMDYSWSSMNTVPIYSTCTPTSTTIDSQQLQCKSTNFTPFSYPPGLIISQSGKKPLSNTFTTSFTPPSSIANHYQIRQMFNSIMPGSDSSFPYNSSMYFLQNYPPILPATNQNLYHQSLPNSKVPVSSTPLPGVPTNNFQRMPLYRFNGGMMNSPSLKSMPLGNRQPQSTGNVPASEPTCADKVPLPKSETF